ncbi:MAG: hypothetical protein KKG99_00450 [Bacteroidetes bacterium]|nr:hypothetical protein [Bacteroidota bacterium]
MKKSQIVTFIILFIIISTYSQNLSLKFHQYTIKDGLSQSTVRGIVQDKYGFIWVGTQDGLNRFDGNEFKIFKNDPKNPHSISDNYIINIYQDSDNDLWIGTQLGLSRYDFESERFIKYSVEDQKGHLISENTINVIAESKETQGLLWLGTKQDLISFNKKTNQFTKYILPYTNSLKKDHPINSIYEAPSEVGILWIGTTDELFRFDIKTGSFEHYNTEEGLSNNTVNYIYEDSQKNLWIGTNDGLNNLNRITKKITVYKNIPGDPNSLGSNFIQNIFEDSRHNLWIGTVGGGLNLFDRNTQRFTSWINQPGNPMSISNNNVWNVFEDQSGILWVTSGGNGLNKINPNYNNFGYYYHDPNNPKSLIGNTIRSIIVDSNNLLWVGTTTGISIIDRNKDIFTHLLHQPDNKNSISSNQIRVLSQDKNGFIWIGTRDGGLDRYDPISKTFRHYKMDVDNPNSISSNNIISIYHDEDGTLWIGTIAGGLNHFNPKTEIFKHYFYDKDDSNSINDNNVFSVIGDKYGNIWLGTTSGVARLNPSTDTFKRYIANPADTNSLSHHFILGLTEDHLGNIWIGTYGGGLNRLDPKTDQFTRYTESDGLPNNSVYIAIEDENNNLWMSTNNGISKLDPMKGIFTNYDIEDGIQESEFNAMAYYKSTSGEIYMGGINGLNIFNPKTIIHNSHIPPVVINDFQIFNKSVSPNDSINGYTILTKSILETESIILTHRENVFSFSFATLDFTNPEKNEFAYILENFDTEWNNVGTRRYVTYTDLPAGKYTFRVIGSSSAGIWNDIGKSIKILIKPPWWETKIFYFTTFLLFVMFLVLFIRLRLRKLKNEKIKLENNVKERTREIQNKNISLEQKQIELKEANATKDKFFSIMAHDLRNPFNVILGYADILNSEYDDYNDLERKRMIQEINKSSQLTFDLLENLLTWSRSQSGKIQIDKTTLNLKSHVLNSIEPSLSNANVKNILTTTEIPENIEIEADKFTIETVIRNLYSNAIKFTPDNGQVKISAIETQNKTKIMIQDNGIGMNKESIDKLFRIDINSSTPGTNNERGTGLGLILCKEFIEMNNGDIQVESKIGKGSKFTISLPKKDILN